MKTRLGVSVDALLGRKPRAACADCDGEGYFYMLRDSLWLLVNRGSAAGFLCLGCVETRLGRPLVLDDFTDVPINAPIRYLFGRGRFG